MSNFTTFLFVGPSYDSYQKVIYVQVYDNDGSYTTYEIPTLITIIPDLTNFETIMDKLISTDPYFSINIVLNQGSFLESIQIIQKISSLLNTQSYDDKLSINFNYSFIAFPQIYGPIGDYTGTNSVNFSNKFLCFKLVLFQNKLFNKDTIYEQIYIQYKSE